MTALSPWRRGIAAAPRARVPMDGVNLLGRLRKIARMTLQGCDFDDMEEAISDCLMLAYELRACGVVPPDKLWIETLKTAGKRLAEQKRGSVGFDDLGEGDYDAWLAHLRSSTPPVQEANTDAHQAVEWFRKLPDRYQRIMLRRFDGESISQIAKDEGASKKDVIGILKDGEAILKRERAARFSGGPLFARQTDEILRYVLCCLLQWLFLYSFPCLRVVRNEVENAMQVNSEGLSIAQKEAA